MKPLAIDLFCGLGGWTSGLLAEGYQVIDIELLMAKFADARKHHKPTALIEYALKSARNAVLIAYNAARRSPDKVEAK